MTTETMCNKSVNKLDENPKSEAINRRWNNQKLSMEFEDIARHEIAWRQRSSSMAETQESQDTDKLTVRGETDWHSWH